MGANIALAAIPATWLEFQSLSDLNTWGPARSSQVLLRAQGPQRGADGRLGSRRPTFWRGFISAGG